MIRLVSVLLVVVLGAACGGKQRVLDVQKQSQLLEQPYPLGYPSTHPILNSVLEVLQPQKLIILNDTYEKNFHVYKVRTPSGREGYVIDRPGVSEMLSN